MKILQKSRNSMKISSFNRKVLNELKISSFITKIVHKTKFSDKKYSKFSFSLEFIQIIWQKNLLFGDSLNILCISASQKFSSHVKFLFHELIVSHKFSAWWSHNKLISHNNPMGAWVTCLLMKLISSQCCSLRMENCSCIWGLMNGLIGGLKTFYGERNFFYNIRKSSTLLNNFSIRS